MYWIRLKTCAVQFLLSLKPNCCEITIGSTLAPRRFSSILSNIMYRWHSKKMCRQFFAFNASLPGFNMAITIVFPQNLGVWFLYKQLQQKVRNLLCSARLIFSISLAIVSSSPGANIILFSLRMPLNFFFSQFFHFPGVGDLLRLP